MLDFDGVGNQFVNGLVLPVAMRFAEAPFVSDSFTSRCARRHKKRQIHRE